VADSLSDAQVMVLDGGSCPVGIESTVVDCTGSRPVILRPGSITAEEIEAVAGSVELPEIQNAPAKTILRSPGLLSRHYAPTLPLRLNVTMVHRREALLAFGQPLSGALHTIQLSSTGDLEEAARHLFAALREADRPEEFSGIAVMPIPDHGIGT